MPQIVKPGTLLLHIINKFEEIEGEATCDKLVRMIAEMQGNGAHIYSYSASPSDKSLWEDIMNDLDHYDRRHDIRILGDDLLMTEVGKCHLEYQTIPPRVEKMVEERIGFYK